MNKILIALLSLVLIGVGCTKDLTNLNQDPKNPAIVPSYTLFTNGQRILARNMSNSNVNFNIFRLIVQQWQETTYTDESNYDLNTRSIPRYVWDSLYRDVLQDLHTAKALIPKDVTDPDIQKNQLAIADIMEVYTYYYLVTTFGNIPYSEALNIDNVFPKYDDQKTVYYDLLTRLDADLAALKASSESFGTSDVIYGGNVSSWRKFAATFKLKLGMTIADFDDQKARSVVESAVQTGVFTSNSDNAIFKFLAAPPNTNPIWEDLVQSGRKDYVASSTFVKALDSLNDPRLPLYFTTDADNGYSGGDPGASSNYATFSKPSTKITLPDFPGNLLDYAETELYLAEAVARGYNVGGSAADHYNKGITASILAWGGTQADATTYLNNPKVNYTTSATNYREKIGVQKWLALYNRGWDGWIEWRRLDYPHLEPAVEALSDIPVRFTYPVTEQNYNTAHYNEAAKAIGSDKVTTKLFWDKF